MTTIAEQTNSETRRPQLHVIVGAGAVGTATAHRLAAQGHHVKIVSRSGTGPRAKNVERVTLDASRPQELVRVLDQATVLYNCANPAYHKWATDWPPLAASLLDAATKSGTVLVTMSNLYGYANPSKPMTESDALRPSSAKGKIRSDMWQAAKAAHDFGHVRITEARASDYLGPQVGANGHMGDRVIPKLLKGKPVTVFGNPRQPHSWTAIDDAARALVTLATSPRAWGHAWHVPTAPPQTAEQLVHRICRIAGVGPVKVRSIPNFVMSSLGLVAPAIRELKEMRYQFEHPFVIDSSAFTKEFGWNHNPLENTLEAIVLHYQARERGSETSTDKPPEGLSVNRISPPEARANA